MLLEGLFGGGNSSSPPPDTQTQPTPPPSSPSAPEPATESVEDETGDDDMPVHHDDGTYSPAPVTDQNASEDIGEDASAEEPDHAAPPVASSPVQNDQSEEPGDDSESEPPSPVATTPSQPAPSNGNTVTPQLEDAVAGIVAEPVTSATRADPVARITDLIAAYEKLLSEPEADENEDARTRAMELAQNRVLTSLISNLSTSDAHAVRTPLDDDTGTDQISLITKYYAEAGR